MERGSTSFASVTQQFGNRLPICCSLSSQQPFSEQWQDTGLCSPATARRPPGQAGVNLAKRGSSLAHRGPAASTSHEGTLVQPWNCHLLAPREAQVSNSPEELGSPGSPVIGTGKEARGSLEPWSEGLHSHRSPSVSLWA